ncbi:hypothetical protein B1759_17940 [Rubrivirga sp. SAORIC476]|uniref:DUF6174 domain-containing protein n=1 Tax=Rubrivirga sp. SAORIC476 TaxID=1961794 RepID=UPI000BA8F8D7|nr:DUF6174 domain-containing protein [Rubrivirga sp. SAORIC476]PAP74315.1 hypothetical protein B1759_17940 [Rubrivirga sp. SAORIC476]
MRALPLILGLLLVAGCDTDPIVGGEALTRGQVEAARASFVASGADSYVLRYAIDCFCPPNEVEVRVADGAVADVSWTSYEAAPLTVLGLYDLVLDAYRQDAALVRATVSATEPRVPADIWIDYDEAIADEEIGYRVLSFDAR